MLRMDAGMTVWVGSVARKYRDENMWCSRLSGGQRSASELAGALPMLGFTYK